MRTHFQGSLNPCGGRDRRSWTDLRGPFSQHCEGEFANRVFQLEGTSPSRRDAEVARHRVPRSRLRSSICSGRGSHESAYYCWSGPGEGCDRSVRVGPSRRCCGTSCPQARGISTMGRAVACMHGCHGGLRLRASLGPLVCSPRSHGSPHRAPVRRSVPQGRQETLRRTIRCPSPLGPTAATHF